MRPLALLGLAFLASCAAHDALSNDDEGERAEEAALSQTNDPDETSPDAREAAPLEGSPLYIDVRGVGDSGSSRSHVSPAPAATFGDALDRFDRSGRSYRGDISFINWETTIAESCPQFSKPYEAGRYYCFISRAENLAQARDRGFNLVGLGNNHSRDCSRTGEGIDGLESTRRAAQALGAEDFLLHGVSADADKRKPVIGRFSIKGRTVRVAFGNVYLGIPSGAGITSANDAEPLMSAIAAADVDLRVLSIHSVDKANQALLGRVGGSFVTRHGGDVVFGTGPHVWAPVRVLRKPNGAAGVVFESTGNFLHPGLAAQDRNYVGRALFDRSDLSLAQVQLVSITNRGSELARSPRGPADVPANLAWRATAEDSGFKVVYANVKP